LRRFALAEAHRGGFFNNELFGLEACARVRAVAERTVAGSTARAPPVGARCELHLYRFRISGYRSFGHKNGSFVDGCGGGVFQNRTLNGFWRKAVRFGMRFPGHLVKESESQPSEQHCGGEADKMGNVHLFGKFL